MGLKHFLLLFLSLIIILSFGFAENLFFNNCISGTDDDCTILGQPTIIELSDTSDAHASKTGYSEYPINICCYIYNFESENEYSKIPFLKLSDVSNAHVGSLYASPDNYTNATAYVEAGMECVYGNETGPTVSGDNVYLPILSINNSNNNSHVGVFESYATKLWCRGGIRMACSPQIRHPIHELVLQNDEGDALAACNDTDNVTKAPLARQFCENVTDCSAINRTTGESACFALGSVYEIDNLTAGSILPEECSLDNRWCPEGFEYERDNDWCEPEKEVCYDDTNTLPSYCWELEKPDTNTFFQRPDWLVDYSGCSYNTDELTPRSCCLISLLGDTAFAVWEDVCVFEPDQTGQNEDCRVN